VTQISSNALPPKASPARVVLRLSVVALAASLAAGCAMFDEGYDARIDYRKASARNKALDVPPDLSQIARDARYQPPGGAISASTFQAGPAQSSAAAASSNTAVAPKGAAGVKIERDGARRWLSTSMPPEKVWAELQAFWTDQGLKLEAENPAIGVMETEWAENRAKVPTDRVRNFLSAFSDSLNSSGERDKYRTRVERSATGSEVFITHKGLAETLTGPDKDTVVWENRPTDLELEAEMLQRLSMRLGGVTEASAAPTQANATAAGAAAAAASPAAPARARLRSGESGATLEIDDGFDRAWRRIGLALDRSGFTVEDRDRGQGLYFVRYVDPALAGKDEPGFLASLLGRKDAVIGVSRYRVSVKSAGSTTTARVLNGQGQPEMGEAAERILKLLLEEVK
jgi:outer membrane protein assembly factor BamC